MCKYKEWESEVKAEFKNSEHYNGGSIQVCSDGSVYLGGLQHIENAVTPFIVYRDRDSNGDEQK